MSISGTFRVTVLVALFACVGCARTVKVAYNPGLAESPPHKCAVSLTITKEFREYRHATPAAFLVHDPFVVEFGPHLRKYAIYVAESVFGDVEVLDAGTARTDSKLLLEPKVLSSDFQPQFNAFNPTGVALSIQWVFRDPRTGKTAFTIPIHCEHIHKIGTWRAHAEATAELMKKLTDTTLLRFKQSKDLHSFLSP
jgi:hypothetical protein